MTATEQLDKYIESFRARLRHVQYARGSAVLALVLLAVAVAAAYVAIDAGFADNAVFTGRLVLLACLAGITWLLIIKPVKRLREEAALDIENRTPAFTGRIVTYTGMQDSSNPFRELLAQDTLQISDQFPIDRQVSQKEFTLPGAVAGASLAVFLGLIIAGPGLLNYGLRHLLAGWAIPGLLPPQTIEVSPGDELVRRGGNVRVSAVMSGFNPETASVHVRMGDSEWQEVEMVQRMEAFEFTFFSVREPLQYYVSSTGIRSPEYEVQVVELPSVRNLKLTYHYPDWTRRPPETVEFGGDIRAVEGTGIDLEVITDAPLPAGLLVLNDDKQALEIKDISARTSFEIKEDGQYFIAAKVGNEQVRLTDDYFIKILEDGEPEIRLVRPGRDWNASNIEEVTARIDVNDDFALESLSLHYSVNGGEWKSIPLPYEERDASIDYTFYLEDMQSIDSEEDSPLVPGDLISYYAEASDRMNRSHTDMFFIQVQPFDRRYTQSQQMGGGGGGRNNPQQEISQRQKEIIVSTWNLIREKTDKRDGDELKIRDNAALLSDLQETLAGQARTLAERTRARQLTSVDDKIGTFVEHLEQAVEAMHPAADRLAAVDLQEAIQPEQEALQHLLRAEAMFNDIQVSFQRGMRGGGGGFQAGRDLAEMFELEMDLEKNQYETGSSASRSSASQEVDDAMQKLEELARRQEQLANNFQRQRQLTQAQRWQQEMLRREAEELQRQLEEMQRQQSAGRAGQGQGTSQSSQGEGEASQSELSRRLGSAIRAMNEATEAMRNNNNSEQLQRAVQEAQRQLEQARKQVAQDQQQSMQESFRDMADSAAELYRRQSRIARKLQGAVREALSNRQDDEDTIVNPLSYEEEMEMAQEKREMLEDLQSLRQNMQAGARNFEETSPEAARELERANTALRDSDIDTRMTIAASYIEQGAALYIASSEGVVTNALRNLQRDLERAESLAAGTDMQDENNLDRALARTRALRRELQQLTQGNGGQARGTQQPEQGAPRSSDTNQAENGQREQAGASTGGRLGGRGRYGYGGWDGWRRPYGVLPPEYRERIDQDINETAGIVNPIIPELRGQGLSDQEIDEIYRILRQLTYAPMDDQKNELILQEEMTRRLALLEQLELRLEQGASREQIGNIRSEVSEPVPAEYKDAVAEYYRRLSKDKTEGE